MQPRPLSNPPNPYASTAVEWLEPPPPTQVQVYEDRTKNILSKNESPDLGFSWSINPYRGCQHACAYCLSGDTPILMADGRTRALADLRPGDEIYGTERRGHYRHYVRTRVIDHWRTEKPAYRVRLADGTEVIASADHRFLTGRGWKFVIGAEQGPDQRPFLTTHVKLMGVGRLAPTLAETAAYKRGYLCGMIRGDGLIATYVYDGRRRGRDVQHHFRLALADLEALHRSKRYLADFDVATRDHVFQEAVGDRKQMLSIRTHAKALVDRVRELIAFPTETEREWQRGFLAGIFDAEGSRSQQVLRISNMDREILAQIQTCLATFGFDHVLEDEREVAQVRVRGGLKEHLRFFLTVDPAITRKRDLAGEAVKSEAILDVISVEPLGVTIPMFDITTGTGDFIANGVVSHNCYARPTHEYLSFGAGTDFDTKIVVKPDAPALLREAFEKKSWKGELIMFSGNTDCYQPLEASYRLTRGLLEVCAEYRNPAAIITKAPLVERDLDVLVELDRVARVSVTVSIPFWDPDKARAVEPWVATPQRRIRTVERLAAAGLRVAVNVAPVIPGLGDEDLVKVLEAAAGAGARHAGIVLLRLPGSVKEVFEERMRAAFPLRADKILHRIRDTRGGKLYDSTFGARQVGEGQYAETIHALFETTCRRLGLNQEHREHDVMPTPFQRPPKKTPQLSLF